MNYESWGRFPKVSHRGCFAPHNTRDILNLIESIDTTLLARGYGNSYGDSCLNENGYLIDTRNLQTIHAFDSNTGIVRCECGVTFDALLRLIVPKGWFLPVTPGTKFITVGGAIANDVHGKNHHKHGSFGNHVIQFELLRSDGSRILCSREKNPEWFRATIGGLGLTGMILWAEFGLERINGPYIEMESIKFKNHDEFLVLSEESNPRFEHDVAWVDCLSTGPSMARGIFMRGNYSNLQEPNLSRAVHHTTKWKSIPLDAPSFFLSPLTFKAINFLYYNKQKQTHRKCVIHYDPFFFPLDSIRYWNRLYGKHGFLQWQCAVPPGEKTEALKTILKKITESQMGSFLMVIKEFGDIPAEGMLSFPMPGASLAMDFANRGMPLFRLLEDLDAIVREAGGRIYPAKDARMSSETFYTSFPEFNDFTQYIDPKFSSSFYRRVRKPKSEVHKMLSKPALITVEDAKQLSADETGRLFKDHMNPGQYNLLKLLGFHKVIIDKAEGIYLIDKKGNKILDFFAVFGAVGFGHNHPRILSARKKFQEELRHEMAIAFLSQYATALARNLAVLAPGDLDIGFLCCSGSEAVEAALKIAEKAQGSERSTLAYAEKSFHGKTRGALSVTDSDLYQSTFKLLEKRVCVPFGDAVALEEAFKKDPSIGVLILETIQGGAGIIVPPPGYLKAVRDICDRYDVLWIADEVQCGMGRTGRLFAFEHEDVVPDLVTMAKSLGGGKVAIGAVIARKPVYMKAYGKPKTALIHGPATFGAMGEACCTAIEALNVLYDEGLIDNAAQQGDYLLKRLEELRLRYPKMIKEVRGKGLMIGVVFQEISQALPAGIRQVVSVLDEKLKGSLCGFIGALLLKQYNVLVAFTEYDRNVIRLEPPLIVQKDHIDTLIHALDSLLSRGVAKVALDYIRNIVKAK